jgi:hypothetical protein
MIGAEDQIAAVIGIDAKTLREHYRKELDTGLRFRQPQCLSHPQGAARHRRADGPLVEVIWSSWADTT